MEENYSGERASSDDGQFTIIYNDHETNFQGRWALNEIPADVTGIDETVPESPDGPEITININGRSFVVDPEDRLRIMPIVKGNAEHGRDDFVIHLFSKDGARFSLEAHGHVHKTAVAFDELQSNYALLETGPMAVSGSWTYIPLRDEFRWSPGMYKLFGIAQNENIRPDIYLGYSLGEDQAIANKIVRAIYEGRAIDELLRIEVEGTIKTLRIISVPRDVSGELHVVGIDIDFTDRHFEKGRSAGQSYEQLKRSDKAKTLFLNNLSQEFQNPMTLILAGLNRIIEKAAADLPDSITNELDHVHRNAVRLEKLMKTLLDFTHLERRRERARFVPSDICELTTELAASFRPIIEKAGLTLTVESDRISEPVYIDQSIFETALYNLLSNAFKFTLKGGITVNIFNRRTHVKVSVTDTGIGILPAHQKKIFQRFAHIEASGARSLEGMGVGLPLVKELIEIHGGSITVSSQPKKGSVFTISLPKGTAHIKSEQLSPPGVVERRPSFTNTLGEVESWPGADLTPAPSIDDKRTAPTVIVAESDNAMRGFIVRCLTQKYKIAQADCGQGVLDLIESGIIPDLIIADAALARINGFELLSNIRNTPSLANLPFILIVSRTIPDEEINGLYYGADDYLVKPFTAHELVARIDSRIQIALMRTKPMQSLTNANTALEQQILQYAQQLETYNKQLNEKNSKLTELNNELTGLTFAASHDLREPLRKIQLFIQRLMKEEQPNLSAKGMEYFDRILSFVYTMNDLVNDIALYANYKELVGSLSTIDLNSMLESLVDYVKPTLQQKDATITFEVTEGLTGYYDQVRQVLYNLISNALKFRREDLPLQITITGKVVPGWSISDTHADKTKMYYMVSVVDNGIGIDPLYAKQVFELFRRLHGKSAYPGTGIGLTIVRRIMENHNGFITLDSAQGKGCNFACYFPVQPEISQQATLA